MKTFTLTSEITLCLGDTPPNYFIPPDERLEWINALNSGEYVQGTGELCFISEGIKRFCCLGVKASLETEPTRLFGRSCIWYKSTGYYLGPCKAIQGNGDFPFNTYVKHGCDSYLSLITTNDSGIPFSVIAQIINIIWCSETWFPYYFPPTVNLL